MAQYKVLQDIEAEDKFVGPLTLKQFILAGIAFVCAYLNFLFLIKHIWFLDVPLVPIMLAAGFLAWPWGRDQPTEVWLLAKIRFLLKPRRRIWDQSGVQELVTITAPKHIENFTGNNLSQIEVKSRLKALADTIDSRGWAVKNASVNLYNQPSAMANQTSDRLIDVSSFAREVPNVDVRAADDILDEKNNPIAVHLNQMVNDSSRTHRQETLQNLKSVREHKGGRKKGINKRGEQPDFWFMHEPDRSKLPKDYAAFDSPQTIHPGTTSIPAPAARQDSSNGHLKVVEPASTKPKHAKKPSHKQNANRDKRTSSKTLNPAILELANNDDLTVATIARQASKKPGPEPPSNEIVVPLR